MVGVYAVEIKRSSAPGVSRGFRNGLEDLKIDESIVIFPGNEDHPAGGRDRCNGASRCPGMDPGEGSRLVVHHVPSRHADELRARSWPKRSPRIGLRSNFRKSERVLSDKSPNWPLIGPIATLKLQDSCARTNESCILGDNTFKVQIVLRGPEWDI